MIDPVPSFLQEWSLETWVNWFADMGFSMGDSIWGLMQLLQQYKTIEYKKNKIFNFIVLFQDYTDIFIFFQKVNHGLM